MSQVTVSWSRCRAAALWQRAKAGHRTGLDDVLNGMYRSEAAERDYGVAIDPDTMKIDRDRTAILRKHNRSSQGGNNMTGQWIAALAPV